MQTIRIIARVASYVTLVLGILYIDVSLYTIAAYILKGGLIEVTADRFAIKFPYSDRDFLLGQNTWQYKAYMTSVIALYGLFFLLLYKVFKAFLLDRLFTTQGIKALGYFSVANLTVPIVAFALYATFIESIDNEFILVILHAIVGIFALFLRAIFKEGLNLQNDQDLTI